MALISAKPEPATSVTGGAGCSPTPPPHPTTHKNIDLGSCGVESWFHECAKSPRQISLPPPYTCWRTMRSRVPILIPTGQSRFLLAWIGSRSEKTAAGWWAGGSPKLACDGGGGRDSAPIEIDLGRYCKLARAKRKKRFAASCGFSLYGIYQDPLIWASVQVTRPGPVGPF